MTRRTVPGALLALSLFFSLTACGEDDATSGSSAAPEVSTDLSVKPEVPASDEEPPTDLVVDDVVEGEGEEAAAGSIVEVKYVGAFYETGEEFDSSWSRGADETLQVELGSGGVIPGFDQGITGMHEGGRRMVTIPSDLGYGEQANGPIPGGSTLVFVIDLVDVS